MIVSAGLVVLAAVASWIAAVLIWSAVPVRPGRPPRPAPGSRLAAWVHDVRRDRCERTTGDR